MEYIGSIGVDSGQIMVGDPCYLGGYDSTVDPLEYADLNARETTRKSYPFDYGGSCAASGSKDQAGVLDNGSGICVSSGFGDGFYPVYLERADIDFAGRKVSVISKVIIDFLVDDDHED